MDTANSGDEELGGSFLDRIREKIKPFGHAFRPDPTVGWMKDPNAELILDLDSGAFSGAKIGDPCSALSFLGSCEKFTPTIFHCMDMNATELSAPQVQYSLGYASRGITVGVDKDFGIKSFLVYFQPDADEPNSTLYAGKIIWKGTAVDRASLQTADSIVSMFGVPDLDDEEPARDHIVPELGREPYRRCLIYEKTSAMWMIEIDESGRAQGIYVSGSRKAKARV